MKLIIPFSLLIWILRTNYKKTQTKKSLNRNIFVSISQNIGYLPYSRIKNYSYPLEKKEEQIIKSFLKNIALKYDNITARNLERIIRVETSHFKSKLFQISRNLGGILANNNYKGKKICFYIIQKNGLNAISDNKEGQKFCYRFYDKIEDALIDLLNVFYKNENIFAYAGIDPVKDPANAQKLIKIYSSVIPKWCNQLGINGIGNNKELYHNIPKNQGSGMSWTIK